MRGNQIDPQELTSKKCAVRGRHRENWSETRTDAAEIAGWLAADARGWRTPEDWEMKTFTAVMSFFNRVAELAEAEGHHPDLHLEGYRNAWIELWTHAIGGLSENDFIMAAKIDQLI